MKKLSLQYGLETKSFEIQGECTTGEQVILLERDDDLTKNTAFSSSGYGVFEFISNKDFQRLRDGISNLIADQLCIKDPNFTLETYHKFVDDAQHRTMTKILKDCFPIEIFPIDHEIILERISNILGFPVTLVNKHSAEISPIFCLRIVRPGRVDNNPLHRDVWLDRLRHAINIYAPIAGSDSKSSLALVSGSHKWYESEIERTAEGATVDGVSFTVPAVTGASKPLELTRPSPGANQFMLFSPYLIHGGGINQNNDKTRVSLEMRFWRK